MRVDPSSTYLSSYLTRTRLHVIAYASAHRHGDYSNLHPRSVGSLERRRRVRASAEPFANQAHPLCRPLLKRCESRWGIGSSTAAFPILAIPNRFEQDEKGIGIHARAHGSKRRFGAGWARNCGAQIARGDILVFLDDDAAAEPDWLEHLLEPYFDSRTIAVGGMPFPVYQTGRPAWFPANFDWVFGCAYEGLPQTLGPAGHLIGANLSVRRDIFERIGGFHSIDFDDLDLCMRLQALGPDQRVLYEPDAVVHHYVPAQRVEWRYFWRRCFFVNREKVEAFADIGTRQTSAPSATSFAEPSQREPSSSSRRFLPAIGLLYSVSEP